MQGFKRSTSINDKSELHSALLLQDKLPISVMTTPHYLPTDLIFQQTEKFQGAKKRAKTFEDEYAVKIAKDDQRYKSIKKEVKLLEQDLKASKKFLSTYKK